MTATTIEINFFPSYYIVIEDRSHILLDTLIQTYGLVASHDRGLSDVVTGHATGTSRVFQAMCFSLSVMFEHYLRHT